MAKVTIILEDVPSDKGLQVSAHAITEPPLEQIAEEGFTPATYLAAEIMGIVRDLGEPPAVEAEIEAETKPVDKLFVAEGSFDGEGKFVPKEGGTDANNG